MQTTRRTRTDCPGHSQHRLLVITGPIASGKSTLASRVADLLRGTGEAVAVIGLDTIAETPAELMRHVPDDVSVDTVLLVTPYEIAVKRAIADPGRGISKDPAFLATMYQRFECELPGMRYDLQLHSGESSPDELAAHVITALA